MSFELKIDQATGTLDVVMDDTVEPGPDIQDIKNTISRTARYSVVDPKNDQIVFVRGLTRAAAIEMADEMRGEFRFERFADGPPVRGNVPTPVTARDVPASAEDPSA